MTEPAAANRNRARDLPKHNTGAILWILPQVGNVAFMLLRAENGLGNCAMKMKAGGTAPFQPLHHGQGNAHSAHSQWPDLPLPFF